VAFGSQWPGGRVLISFAHHQADLKNMTPKEVVKVADRENAEFVGRSVDLLEQARREVTTILASEPGKFSSVYLGDLLSRIDERIVQLRYNLSDLLSKAADAAVSKAEIVSQSLPTGITVRVGLDPNLVRSLTDYRSSLIRSVTDDTRNMITEIVRRSMISGQNLGDTLKEIGSVLPGAGPFGTIVNRAEAIIRTEYGRMFNAASQAGYEQSLKYIPGLKKQWLCTFRRSRQAHIEAHDQTVPIMSPFIVGGEPMMFPLDPAGTAGNVVNCLCYMIPVLP